MAEMDGREVEGVDSVGGWRGIGAVGLWWGT